METLATNKKAYFDYEILEKLETGIVLSGMEIKATKTGKASLAGSFAIIRNNQAYLLNLSIAPYQPKNINFKYIPDTLKQKKAEKLDFNTIKNV